MAWVLDTKICKTADGDATDDMRGLIRVGRRVINRCWLDRETILRRRLFCQNSGACGSTYIVRLLQENGVEKSFHEKTPDLYELGLQHYELSIRSKIESVKSRSMENRLVRLLRYTRHDVDFEANNRLFSLSQELAAAFPNLGFIHLHRDGTEAVRSAMSKPDVASYLRNDRRFQGGLAGDHGLDPFSRFCQHWANMNLRIADDIDASVAKHGCDFVQLRFEDLVAGAVAPIEEILGTKLRLTTCSPVNVGKVKTTGKFPKYSDWTSEQKVTFDQICGTAMSRLGR